MKKETWKEDELIALLFGENPDTSSREIEQDPPVMLAARIYIWADPPIGIKAKKIYEKVQGEYMQVRYYAPSDVFHWVANKHFPQFPKFPDLIDWAFWLAMPEIELWEACALSLSISPESLERHSQGGMVGSLSEHFFQPKSFQSKGIEDQFVKRMRLVKASIREISGRADAATVRLADLVKWWPLSMGLLPAEIRTLHHDSARPEILNSVSLFEQPPPSAESAALSTKSVVQSHYFAARIKPEGGDSLTPMIWGMCYDICESGETVKPSKVMSELRARAEQGIWPLVGIVAGGVKFEYEKGEEKELSQDALRKRIDGWKEAVTGD